MQSIEISNVLAPFVKEIFLLRGDNGEHHLPFYADGYPGIMYSRTDHEIKLMPLDKGLSEFFLYGQTIEPIALAIRGKYKIVVFQLYPFATRLLLGINPKKINDLCFDLGTIEKVDTDKTISKLRHAGEDAWVDIIAEYVLDLVHTSSSQVDTSIKLAVSTIMNRKGHISVAELRQQLYIHERTFERRFTKAVGVTPKQFARIIQFNFSLDQLKEADYTTMTSIAYDNGFSDQSHFIRTFKKYTGLTPKGVLEQLEAIED